MTLEYGKWHLFGSGLPAIPDSCEVVVKTKNGEVYVGYYEDGYFYHDQSCGEIYEAARFLILPA